MASIECSVLGERHTAKVSTAACVRCRQKKKRCDQKLPRCRLCERAGVECYVYEPAAKRQVPRSYVQSLEERVAYLESKLRDSSDHGSAIVCPQTLNIPRPTSVVSGSASLESLLDQDASPGTQNLDLAQSDAAKNTLATIHRLQHQPLQPEHDLSKLLLKDLMTSRATVPAPTVQQDQTDLPVADIVGDLDTGPITLPSKQVATNLVREFFLSANLGLSLLHEPTFAKKLACVYDMPQTVDLATTHTSSESRISVFFVLEVFSIALLVMQKRDPSKVPTWLADRYHKGAVTALTEAGLPNDIEGVQALLLIGQFYYFHPTLWTIWNTVGAALRLAVELDLHHDPPPGDVDALSLDIRRRTFWVAYSMDRNIAIAKSMTTCLSDGAIDCKFPSAVDDHHITSDGIDTARSQVRGSKLVSLHLYEYRQIQSEMRTVLSEKPPLPYQPIDIDSWQQRMRDRIGRWYDTIPFSDKLSPSDAVVIETFELTCHTALFYLHRPWPNNPAPNGSQLVAMTQSAVKMIQLLRKFFLEKKLTIYWQAVENLSSAGTALMYGYANSPELREYMSFRSLESTLHTCSSVLWGMVERFPAFQGKRDAFDLAVTSVLADLNSSMVTSDGQMEMSPTVGMDTSNSRHQAGATGQEINFTEAEPESQPLPSTFIDFGGLTTFWDGAVDLSGTPTPTWI